MQVLVPLSEGGWSWSLRTHALACQGAWQQSRALQVPRRGQRHSKQVPPAHGGHRPGCLYHGIEGAAAVVAASWRCLGGWCAPTLGGVRGHQQGTAAVDRALQVC